MRGEGCWAFPQRTRLEMELDRAVDGVSLDAGARVAEGYHGCGGGNHGIAAAEHTPAMVCRRWGVCGGVCGDGARSRPSA